MSPVSQETGQGASTIHEVLERVCGAMHIAEGFLPPAHAIAWSVASAPFVVHGVRSLTREVREHPESTLLLGASGAFTFVLSALKLPSVIALRQFVKPSEYPAFTRFNLFLRDRFSCVYCGSRKELTFDHVVPRAQGGRTTWENVATACAPCNLKKGGRTPRQASMHIEREPIRPTSWQLQDHGRSFPPNYLHQSWRDYLYWDIELEP